MTRAESDQPRLRLLLDSNVFIAIEPYAGGVEQDALAGLQLVRLANEQGHLLCIAPATRDDLLQGRDLARRAQRLAELEKVDRTHAGVKYGELLLKAVLNNASKTRVASLYVEVLPSHPEVIEFFNDFGFSDSGLRNHRDERVLRKLLLAAAPFDKDLSDLEYHISYGPPALRPTQQIPLVPIRPRWHEQLFPEQALRSEQPSLFDIDVPSTHPWGNALRKAYLCNAPIKSLQGGDLLLFYRSTDLRGVSVIGIVENVIRSRDVDEVVRFVGRRTVYSPQEIAVMCRASRGVLAIRFRQDRFVEPPWDFVDLKLAGVLQGPPQTISTVRAQGRQWILNQINELV